MIAVAVAIEVVATFCAVYLVVALIDTRRRLRERDALLLDTEQVLEEVVTVHSTLPFSTRRRVLAVLARYDHVDLTQTP